MENLILGSGVDRTHDATATLAAGPAAKFAAPDVVDRRDCGS